jgi:hypothetical protein
MSDRDEVLRDKDFWDWLEYGASAWLASSADRNLRRFGIDGFAPEFLRNTKRGADIEGVAWVGEGSGTQHPYRFLLSLPQRLLHRRRHNIEIESLALDEGQQTLEVVIKATDGS